MVKFRQVLLLGELLTAVNATDCIPQPSDIAILIDGTKNVNTREREQMEQLTTGLVSKSPDLSTVSMCYVGDISMEITTINKPYLDLKWVDKLRNHTDMKKLGVTISSTAIDNKVNEKFSVNQYKTKAEIVVVLVSSETKLNNISQLLAKKKTFVVLFGSTSPSIWKDVATQEDHLFMVKDKGDLENVTAKLIRQISCDSEFYCDIDMYSVEKGYPCKTCEDKCGKDPVELKGTVCAYYCPYLPLKSQKGELPTTNPSTTSDVALLDNKMAVVGLTAGVIVVLVVLVVIVIRFIKRNKTLTPSSSDETLPKTREERVVPLSPAVQETEENNEEETPLRSSTDDSLESVHEGSLDSVYSAGTGQRDHFSSSAHSEENCTANQMEDSPTTVTFKSKREMDLNAHYFDGNVRDLRVERAQRDSKMARVQTTPTPV